MRLKSHGVGIEGGLSSVAMRSMKCELGWKWAWRERDERPWELRCPKEREWPVGWMECWVKIWCSVGGFVGYGSFICSVVVFKSCVYYLEK